MSVNSKMTALADKIRALFGTSGKMSIDQMTQRVDSANNEVSEQTDLLEQIAAELAGKAAGSDIKIQTDKEAVTPSKVSQTVWPDTGYDALAKVTVKAIPSEYIVPSGTKNITQNGTHDVSQYAQAIVNVNAGSAPSAPQLQEKTIRPNAEGQTVRPDTGYDGLSVVYITGDSDLVPENIKSGIDIFGVKGTFTGSGGDSSGLPAGISALASGTFTPGADVTSTHYVTHGLGVKPNFVQVMLMDALSEAVSGMLVYYNSFEKSGLPEVMERYTCVYYNDAGTITQVSGQMVLHMASQFGIPITSGRKLKAGYTYRWVAGVMDGIG